jgi:hypothetical protein
VARLSVSLSRRSWRFSWRRRASSWRSSVVRPGRSPASTSAVVTQDLTAVSVRSKSRATWEIVRSPARHRSTISALNSGVNDLRARGFFRCMVSMMGILSGASHLMVDVRQTVPTPLARPQRLIPNQPRAKTRPTPWVGVGHLAENERIFVDRGAGRCGCVSTQERPREASVRVPLSSMIARTTGFKRRDRAGCWIFPSVP